MRVPDGKVVAPPPPPRWNPVASLTKRSSSSRGRGLTAFTNVHFDDGLLPYWLRYYSNHGVTKFVLIYQCPRQHVECAAREYDCDLVRAQDGSGEIGPMDTFRVLQEVDSRIQDKEWFLVADLDEFHWFSGLGSFMSATVDAFDYIPSRVIDRIDRGGEITCIDRSRTLCSQYPLKGGVTRVVTGGCTRKVALCRKGFGLSGGHHSVWTGRAYPMVVETHHFKWRGPTLSKRSSAFHSATWASDWKGEYGMLIDYLETHGGRIDVSNPEIRAEEGEDIGI
jgi:hypothetical protein